MRFPLGLFLPLILLAGCETLTGLNPGAESYDSVPNGEVAQASFSGDTGSSIKHAIIITDTANEKTGVRAEYVWLHERYPGYRLRHQELRHEKGKSYDVIRIVAADGKSHSVFFDITAFFGKF